MEDIHSGPATNTNPIVFFDIALGGELPVLDLYLSPYQIVGVLLLTPAIVPLGHVC